MFASEGMLHPTTNFRRRLNLSDAGAKHLYLLDYNGDDLPNLASQITSTYKGCGVCFFPSEAASPKLIGLGQVTTISADATEDAVISELCDRALKEHGRLDVFFANVGLPLPSWCCVD